MSDIVERLRDKWQHSEEDCYAAAAEIERLQAENEAGLRNTLAMQNAANVLRIRAKKAEAEIERLKAALKFYADKDHYEYFPGARARAALEGKG